MSDNVTQLNMDNRPDRRAKMKKIVILLVVVIAVISAVGLFLFREELNLDGVRRWGKYLTHRNDENYGSFSFDSHSSSRYANFHDGLAVASVGGLSVYDESGEERFVIQQQIDLPELLVSGDMAVIYDVAGHSLAALHEKHGEVLKLEETHPILDADLSSNGSICLSSSTSGYKSVLSVYNKDQDLVYRWLSSSTYYPLCAIAPNGRDMAAVAMGQKDGEFESSICLFRTDSEEILSQISLGGELIYDLVYIEDDELCAVGENGIQILGTDGKLIGRYDYQDPYLKDFDFGGDGFLTLATNMYRAGNRYSLVTVDEKGRQIGSCYLGQEVLDLSACGRYIAVLTHGKLLIYTQSLSLYHETTETEDATSVVMREDGTVLLISGGKGKLYVP